MTHVAIVLGPEGVRAVTAAGSIDRLMENLADYIRQNAELLLWPADAQAVLERLASGRCREAVDHYFLTVGDRWEREVLETFSLTSDQPWAVPAGSETAGWR
jgi:hypothetical protein